MFPQKSKFLKRPIGWKDLNKMEGILDVENGKTVVITKVHNFCCTRLHIGKENGELFKFCPRCLIKITNNNDK